ncbi:MAG TPA: phenylalanine--tRNA ligase beta subunit-related protein, partial [Candidatus Omnitrophota bacterium]|nr:phenylalanine--tRNA ligase beta subunit-related protein [Candidatus Omnitrophota bacterium]
MKISLEWIKEYVGLDITVPELVHKLTMAGIEAEKIESIGKDTVIEFEITPNRPDCLNMLGIAREVAAVLKKDLKEPALLKRSLPKQACNISIEAKEACKRYIGTLIEGVSVKSSPDEIKTRLQALGNRPISNIVDITNYCLFELGHPLHAFDYDKLKGGQIIVRYARKGEKIVTLDGQERE